MTSTATTAPCGHHTTEPAQLCNPCTTHLHQRLTRMQPLYAALSGFLAPTGRRPEYGTAPATEAPLPVRTEVLDLRGPGGIVGILEDWRAAAHAARGFTPPDAAGLIPTRIEAAACALQANMSWISLTWLLRRRPRWSPRGSEAGCTGGTSSGTGTTVGDGRWWMLGRFRRTRRSGGLTNALTRCNTQAVLIMSGHTDNQGPAAPR
jgi:hypothetical protein